MQWLSRFALLSLLVSPAALAEQLYRAKRVPFRQPSSPPARQSVPGDRAPDAVRLNGSQRLQSPHGEPAPYFSPANGYSIEPGRFSDLAQHSLGWLSEPS
jgi:hypothetical protein